MEVRKDVCEVDNPFKKLGCKRRGGGEEETGGSSEGAALREVLFCLFVYSERYEGVHRLREDV